MDFDSLAAQFGVTKLYPSARMVLGFPLTGNVRDYLALYRSSLPITQIKYTDLSKISRVFIVDCQHAERLDELAKSLLRKNGGKVPFTIFDHHDLDGEGLGPLAEPDSCIERVGAATTIVVDKIREQDLPLTPFEATLLAIGIYEDTGCLTYCGTTEKDARCVAFLLSRGADLAVINDFIHPKLNQSQTDLLQELIKNADIRTINGARVVFARAEREKYIDGLASMTRKLIDIESCDSAFTVVLMRDRVHIVGRSDSRVIDVRSVVREFNGDGHPGAGSAVVRGGDVGQVLNQVEELASRQVPKQKTANQIMTTPVRTILSSVSMDEAGRIMIRHGLDGLLIAENDRVVGVVSRRDIDQAVHHKLSHAPVLGFMSKPVMCIAPETTLSEIQRLMVEHDIGRLPVLDKDEKILGLVSRHDVLYAMYGTRAKSAELVTGQTPIMWRPRRHVIDFAEKFNTVQESTLWLSRRVGEVAPQLNMVAYAVGGFVRDLILGRPNFDLDYVIEGNAITLAKAMEERFPLNLKVVAEHDRFQTATLDYTHNEQRSVDFSTARSEFYEYPAALPTVEPSRLDQDLMRRDFTINAMAICLNSDRYGELIDEFGGMEDLQRRTIRVLHPFSFIEDPTRIIRAVRFAARLGFDLDPETAQQAEHAVSIGIFDNLGGTRMRDELRLILESPQRKRGLDLLAAIGARLRYLDAELEYTRDVRKAIRRAERLLNRVELKQAWVVYLGLLVSQLCEDKVSAILDRLHLTNDQKSYVMRGLSVRDELPQIFEQWQRDKHGLSHSEIYHLLHGRPDEALAIAASLAHPGSPVRRMIKLYLDELETTKIELNGIDLIKLGFKQGAIIGEVLSTVLDAKLDGQVRSRDDELAFIRARYPQVLGE
jgi:tRNA nucleotidyltransferase (CCA-adding enzyme)